MVRDYGLAAVANACAHPVLAGRAQELGALEQMRNFLKRSPVPSSSLLDTRYQRSRVGRNQRAETAVARLTGAGHAGGDIEEGAGGGGEMRLHFYTFKWGVHPSVRVSFMLSPKDRVWAIAGCMFWAVIVFLVLRPILVL